MKIEPWRLVNLEGKTPLVVEEYLGETLPICQVEDLDDARLIAAAPRLLVACKLVLAFMREHHPHDGLMVIQALEKGIKQSEGNE